MNAACLLSVVCAVFAVGFVSTCSESYTSWILRGVCNDSCGGSGVQRMIRSCAANCSCGGPFEQWTLCNDTPCVFPRSPCFNGLQRVFVNGRVVCGYTANDA